VTAGFSFDDEPTVNSQDELKRAVTSDKWRAHLYALAASHLSQLDHRVGVGLALPGVPQGECGTRGRQAVPLHLAQLDHQVDVGAGLVPAFRKGAHEGRPYASWFGGNVQEGTASRPPTARGPRDIGVQENEICTRLSPKGAT
jgi:hypothetical protein